MIDLSYEHFSATEILDLILPESLPRISGFGSIGHILQVNLKLDHFPYRKVIGQVLLDKIGTAKTIVAKNDTLGEKSKAKNRFRILPFEVIGGVECLETVHVEHGCKFHLNLAETYWNSRLQEEHQYMAQHVRPSFAFFEIENPFELFLVYFCN